MEEKITLCGDNCIEFPCEKISNMLEKAFFDKENNLRK